jgi:hypothetical protein
MSHFQFSIIRDGIDLNTPLLRLTDKTARLNIDQFLVKCSRYSVNLSA